MTAITANEAPPVAETAPARARRVWSYLAVAIAFLGLGAAGALLFERSGDRGAAPAGEQDEHAGMQDMTGERPPPGASDKAVHISSARQQLIGVRTAVVAPRNLETSRRVVATIGYDETKVTEVHPRVAGWVEQLHVDFVGKSVRKGEPLFTVYSPELASAQGDYLVALRAGKALGQSGMKDGASSMLSSARARLKRLKMGDKAIDRLAERGKVSELVTISSPFAGVVLERNTYAGQYVTPEMATFRIGDLSTIWVIGQVFEYELGEVRVGQRVQVEFPYQQSTRKLEGEIDFVYPEIDPMTRRAKIRAVFDNPGLELKPSTYVTLLVKGTPRRELALPREAILDDGNRQYVLLALERGYFEPREVKLGPPADDYVAVRSGLTEGERVVVSAQFLVDSETNLKAAMQAMMMSMPGMDMGEEDHSGHSQDAPPPKELAPQDKPKAAPKAPAKPKTAPKPTSAPGNEHQGHVH